MKLTNQLNHAKYFWWGKGWGTKPRINTDNFYYKMQWKAKAKRPLEVIEQTLPENIKPIDPNIYVRQEINREFHIDHKFKLPWPYSHRPIKGTPEDPNYKQETALVFHRNKRLIEPINLPLHFTNSLLENDLPQSILKFQNQIQFDDKLVDYCRRRFEWSLFNDCAMQKLPLNREFPYLDQKPPRVFGTTINRKECLILQTLYEISNSWTAKTFGYDPNLISMRISRPHCVYPIRRDEKYALLDLECDFVTILSPTSPNTSLKSIPFDPDYVENASNRPLKSISPISWQVGFDNKNFYPDDFKFIIPAKSQIHTIFLSNNNVRLLNDEDYQGHGIMFCYGYAMQQAKLLENHEQKFVPQTIQCLYTSPKDSMKIGFVLFQLNSIAGDDSMIRNQVWISEPRSVMDDTRAVLNDLFTIQSFRVANASSF
uniref:Uncharacterized protein LOC113793096 n=1 Tax=Dermatophagoides pteronyssinus TaxID=6956 RepID=A0A6P6Y083_DERPT|nr:uncharacterized protein LOC113793096 [Dermatophagoides pteronyssinus]